MSRIDVELDLDPRLLLDSDVILARDVRDDVELLTDGKKRRLRFCVWICDDVAMAGLSEAERR